MTLNGRMGNQMFQYAFAIALSKNYGTYYLIDNSNREDQVKKYFNVPVLASNRISRKFLKKGIAPNIQYIEQKNHEPVNYFLENAGNNCYYKGFFQSESFFHNYFEAVKKNFSIRTKYKKMFDKKYGYLFSDKVIVIHCRLGDYLTWGSELLGGADLTLPESYYTNALKKISGLNDYRIIIVTDDKTNILNKLPQITNKIIISDDEIMDFQFLINADIIISSNSTFSWWGSYLNEKNAVVYAPRNWLGFKVNKEYPPNIIPDRFIKISVTNE